MHERATGHGWVCFDLRAENKPACKCEACADETTGDGRSFCACRRFMAVSVTA
jgi:hypothetical protein